VSAKLYNWFRESSISPVFSIKSRSVTDLAENFQERQGVNVKTNDSGCKERDRKKGDLWRRVRGKSGGGKKRTSTDGAVTRLVAVTQTMTVPFYFPYSLVSLAEALATFISLAVLAISSIPGVHPSSLALHGNYLQTLFTVRTPYTELYLMYSAIGRSILIVLRSLSGFSSLRVAQEEFHRYLFTVMGAVASIKLVKVDQAARKGFTVFSLSH